MTAWNPQTLQQIAAADEVHIAPRREDGSLREPTLIWIARDGDDLYVRSYNGPDGAWWKAARASGAGHLSAAGVEADVALTPIGDAAVNDRVDAAYRAKYGQHTGYVEAMVAERARGTTLRLVSQA